MLPIKVRIADVAVTKCHQWLDELLIFFTRTIQKISKVVYKKTQSETHTFIITSVCCMKCAHFLCFYRKRMLCGHNCVKFRGRIAWHSFLENNFAEFLDEVRVQINQDFVQSLVAFRYSNSRYWTGLICFQILCKWPSGSNLAHILNIHQYLKYVFTHLKYTGNKYKYLYTYVITEASARNIWAAFSLSLSCLIATFLPL